MMRKILIFFLFFIEVLSPNLVFLPIRTRWILSGIGFVALLHDYKFFKFDKKETKLLRRLVYSLVALYGIAIITTIVNGAFDSYFFRYPFSILLSFISAYGFFAISGTLLKKRFTYEEIFKYVIVVMLVQCIISLICFIKPSVGDVLYSIFEYSEMAQQANETTLLYRGQIVGFGIAYFGAGMFYAFTLCFIAYLIFAVKRSFGFKFAYLLMGLIILVIGSAIARTTLVGIIGFLLCFLFGRPGGLKRLFKYIPIAFLLLFALVFIYNTYLVNDDTVGPAFERAFGIIRLYVETGSFGEAESYVGHSLLPDNLKTWIIGDGLWADPQDPELCNYMHVDRGYNRLIFGIGLIGLFVYSLVQLYLCRLTRMGLRYEMVLFVLYLIAMIKGNYSVDVFLAPLFTYVIYEQIQISKSANYESSRRILPPIRTSS